MGSGGKMLFSLLQLRKTCLCLELCLDDLNPKHHGHKENTIAEVFYIKVETEDDMVLTQLGCCFCFFSNLFGGKFVRSSRG